MAIRTLVLALAAALLTPLSAGAQIYAWRDVNGTLVLSDRKLDDGALTYAVPDAPGIRATTPLLEASYREQFEPLVLEHASRHALRPELVRAVIQVESGFNPRARSPRGAMGLMQLMPATAKQYGVQNAFNPAENVRAGVAYLRELLDRYRNNEELALAAYNAGPGAVDKHGQSVPPYRETQSYVAQINKMAARPIELRSTSIYKVTETTADGRPVVRYTDRKPTTGTYDVVSR